MDLFKSTIAKTSTRKSLWYLFIISHLILLLMMTFTFPAINNQIGTKAFDLQSFGYSFTEAEAILVNLNSQTTDLYVFPQLTALDLLYPFLLALFLSSLTFRLFKTTESNNRFELLLLLIPFIAMTFDYLENICILLMITKSIVLSEMFVLISSSFTILKGLFTTIAWATILVYSIKWINSNRKRAHLTP